MNFKDLMNHVILKKICVNKALFTIQFIITLLLLNPFQTFAGVPPGNLLTTNDPFQQEKKITGKVIDQAGIPIPGVSVIVKGTTTGIITDNEGTFTMMLPEGARVLSFSFVGMAPLEVEIGDKTFFNVALEESAVGLDEVIVIGYGTQKKSHLTGAISKVTNQGLEQIPTSRTEEALIGKVSGVNIQMVDASAGSAPTIRVRGVGSITADASPLIVMDGVVVSSDYLGSIDMADVESVEVLKDAASAAIYGSRGGNGVIMITTKKGIEGKTVFSLNAYKGIKYAFNFRISYRHGYYAQ